MKDYEKVYNEFWKPILEEKGRFNKTQMKKELWDWHYAMDQIGKVYCEITNGLLSKPMYPAETVIGVYQDDLEKNYIPRDTMNDDIKNILKEKVSAKQKLKEIIEYLEIEGEC
jgi:hypothetical protein